MRSYELEAIPTMTPRERGQTSNRTFNSAQLGGTRSSTRFGVLVPEVKANRQNVKIRKQSGQKMAVKKILGSKSLCEHCYFTLLLTVTTSHMSPSKATV